MAAQPGNGVYRELPGSRENYVPLREDTKAYGLFQALQDYRKLQDPRATVRPLIQIAESEEDSFLLDDKRLYSARDRANRLAATLSKDEREFYLQGTKTRAEQLLEESGRNGNDLAKLLKIYDQCRLTPAGFAAGARLATIYLELGRHDAAALLFDELIARPDEEAKSPLVLFRAAVAFGRDGQPEKRDQALVRLKAALGKKSLRLGRNEFDFDKLDAEAKRTPELVAPYEGKPWISYEKVLLLLDRAFSEDRAQAASARDKLAALPASEKRNIL